jgi:hypothetical protein
MRVRTQMQMEYSHGDKDNFRLTHATTSRKRPSRGLEATEREG